mmetsp:Transcript_8390/g.12404  ORF Transcript_8390/g.12404 Transcript_8390/m.12404 type:complete len:511 (+) Transcript_8390:42-1574(+)
MSGKLLKVKSENVTYNEEEIVSTYEYQTTKIRTTEDQIEVTPVKKEYTFKTKTKVPKLGVMLVGLGGNNGTTVTASILANKHNIEWETKEGKQQPNYWGSITQASTTLLGFDEEQQKEIYLPLKNVVPMVDPNDFVIGGWDINNMSMDKAMNRAGVLPIQLQHQLEGKMKNIEILPGIYREDFIASNQAERANHVIPIEKTAEEQMNIIRNDIKQFKEKNECDKVIVLWTANTERFAEVRKDLNDTAEALQSSIKKNETEIAPSTLYAVASILEGCSYINGSPQNTFVPGVIELAKKHKVFIGGDDFKSGQTKIKSVLADFLVSAGIKPVSIVSYNHLGNNDGKNLSAPKTFRSKEISKRGVVDDVVESNEILYAPNEHPDHTIVIKYVPFVGDSKRAMDEYTSKIFMNGLNTIVLHNTCEDSLLAAPLILDLIVLTELMERVTLKQEGQEGFQSFGTILTILSYLMKAPLVPSNTPLVNALFRQKNCIHNILKALVGLPPSNDMLLEFK